MMDYSSSQQHQETLESILVSAKPQQEKKPRPVDQQALKCPRCDSTNTKFCYYNNYSLSQPRYFCKSCRRYWTKGGTLRNVPVGGGCRKNKRVSTSSSSSSKRSQDQAIPSPIIPCLAPLLHYDSNDLGLAIARFQKQKRSGEMGFEGQDFGVWANPNANLQFNDSSHGLHMNNMNSSFGSMRSAVLETHHPNLYYEQIGELGIRGSANQDLLIPFEGYTNTAMAATTAAVKQEICSSKGGESRVLWGFPYGGGGDGGDLGWGSVGGSSSTWHGLLNSPLM